MVSLQLNALTGRVSLQVPPRKMGAVLGAIGAALDGRSWNPSELRKGSSKKAIRKPAKRSRGKRGGSRCKNRSPSVRTNPTVAAVVGGENQLAVSVFSMSTTGGKGVAPSRQPAHQSSAKPCSGHEAASVVTPAPIRKATNRRGDCSSECGASNTRRGVAPLVTRASNTLAASRVVKDDESLSNLSEASPAASNLSSAQAGAIIDSLKTKLAKVNQPPPRPELPPTHCSCGSNRSTAAGEILHRPFQFRSRRVSLFSEETRVAYENDRKLAHDKFVFGCREHLKRVVEYQKASIVHAGWIVGSNLPDHLIDCGPGCECAARSDSDYLVQLSRVRRFLPRRAGGNPARGHPVRG